MKSNIIPSIPVIKQTYPVIKNAKTMFSVLNEFKKSDSDNFEKGKGACCTIHAGALKVQHTRGSYGE